MGKVVPQILTKYGANKTVGISAKLVKAPAVTEMKTTGQTIDGSALVTITVAGETALEVEFDNINAAGKIFSKDGKVFGSFPTTKIGTIASIKSTLGLTAAQFGTQLQALVDKEIAIVNTALTTGVVIPSIVGIQVTNAELNFFDGYLALGVDVTQTTFIGLRSLMNAWADDIETFRAASKEAEQVYQQLFLQN